MLSLPVLLVLTLLVGHAAGDEDLVSVVRVIKFKDVSLNKTNIKFYGDILLRFKIC